MTLLGIDWGKKKIGIAFASGSLAEPYGVVRNEAEIHKIVAKEKIEKIIIGISESQSAKMTREFGLRLSKELKIPVEFQDETLTTSDAQRLSLEANMNRKKRKGLEDAFAAAVMLQSYLDSQTISTT